jgi:hypothetical protein
VSSAPGSTSTFPGSTARASAPLRRPGRRGGLRPPLAGRPGRRRVGGGHLAHGLRRPRPRTQRELRCPGGAGPGPGSRARRSDRYQPGRTDAHGPRDRGPEAAVAPCRPARHRVVVPALLRTRRRIRSGRGPHHGPRASTAAGSSTVRRSGPPTPSSPTGPSAWPAATAPWPSTRGCRSSSSTCTPTASRCVPSSS